MSVSLRPGFTRAFSLHFACAMLQSVRNSFPKKEKNVPLPRENEGRSFCDVTKVAKTQKREGDSSPLFDSVPLPPSGILFAGCFLSSDDSSFIFLLQLVYNGTDIYRENAARTAGARSVFSQGAFKSSLPMCPYAARGV